MVVIVLLQYHILICDTVILQVHQKDSILPTNILTSYFMKYEYEII
jgi:hypothetical protein